MRLILRVAAIVLLAAGVCLAQETKENSTQAAESKSTVQLLKFTTVKDAAMPVGRPSLFPATPAPAPAVPAAEDYGMVKPAAEVALGYLFTRLRPGDNVDSFNSHGGFASANFPINDRWGITGEFTGSRFSRDAGLATDVKGKTFSYLAGPRYSWRKWPRAVPFIQGLLGGARLSELGSSDNSFAMALGGGLDLIPHRVVGIRLFQADYLMTRFPEGVDRESQHNFRLGTGILFRFGVTPPVVAPPNRAPTAQCSATPRSLYVGDESPVALRADASDADNDTLNYEWSSAQGSVEGTGATVRWSGKGLPAGRYPVAVRVSDGKGGTTSCETAVMIETKPNTAPTLTCSADRSSVLPGERVRITGTGRDADNDSLNYTWKSTGGQVSGSGSAVQLDTTGLSTGRYVVTGRVEDGRGGAADCQVGVQVNEPPPPPQAEKINECMFRAGSSRVDNVCKRILDDVALRLNNDPSARVGLVGFADPKEARAAKLGLDRATQSAKYLGEKGIPASRIDTRSGTGQAGADKQNRRIDIIWVPSGATF